MKKRNSKSLWLTRGHRYDFGSWMMDQTKSSVDKAFNVDGVFNFTKTSGSIGSTLGALGDIIGTSKQLGTITDTSDDKGLIQDFQNTTFSGNTTDSLLGQWNSTDFLDNQYDMEDIRGYSNGEMIGKIGGSIGKGALAGAKYGPIGALVGAAVGGISSGIGAAVGTNKAKREAEELKRLQNKANAQVIDTFDSQAKQVNWKNALNRNIYANGGEISDMNEYKDGGSIHIKKKNKGKFTEAAKRAGMGVQEYARHVLANKERYSPTLVKRANFARNSTKFKHDLGGFLFNHGAEWNNGVSTIDTGGPHESNPYGGIPMGIAPDNQPNLVEQGEVIYKDYVFSNRLAPTKDELKLVKLPEKYNDWSFARIAEDMNRESSERPNDPISKRGLEDSLGKLMMIQEKQRMEKGKKGTQQMMAYGGHRYYGLSDFPYYNPEYDTTLYFPGMGVLKEPTTRKRSSAVKETSDKAVVGNNVTNGSGLNTYSNFKQLSENTPFYTPEYLGFWDYLSNNRDSAIGKSLLNDINAGKFGDIGGNTFTLDDILRLSRDYKKGPVHHAFLKYASDYNNNPELSDINIEDASIDPATLEAEKKALQDALTYKSLNVPLMEMPSDELDSSLRYAPVVGSAIGYLQSAFANPDYEHASYLTREANRLEAPQVRFKPLNRYLRYNPIDRNYLLNQLKSQAGATRRMVRNAGTNPGTTMAGLLAADYNAQNAVGNNLIQMQQYNDALRQSVENFNRGTDQYNSQGFLQSDMFNAESKANRDALRLSYMDRAAQMREQSDAMLEAVRSNNFSNLMTQLGQIGRENQDVNILEKMKASDLFGVLNDAMRGNLIGKNGGMLTKKNKRRKK